MFNKKPIISGGVILLIILNLRITFNLGETSFNILTLLSTLPIIMTAAGLAFLGSVIRKGLMPNKLKSARYFINFIMVITAIEMIVWISILFTSNYGLTGFFIPLFFLPYGYFFIKIEDKHTETKNDDIFELYDTEYKEDDIFEEYLRNQDKDRYHNQ